MFHQPVVGGVVELLLHQALGSAAHNAGIVDDAGIALEMGNGDERKKTGNQQCSRQGNGNDFLLHNGSPRRINFYIVNCLNHSKLVVLVNLYLEDSGADHRRK